MMRSVDEYLELITSEHKDKPKYMTTVKRSLEPIVATQIFLLSLSEAFDLDKAIGKQLDAVGEWIGRSRRVDALITDVYFTWDDDSLGWEYGVWKGQYDPDTGLVELPDDIYRLLLKAKIAANNWDGTISGAYEAWKIIFGNSAIIIQDNHDMSMVVGIAGIPLTPLWEALLTQGYIPLKPEGVRINYYAITDGGEKLFAWDVENSDALAGWEQAGWPREIKVIN